MDGFEKTDYFNKALEMQLIPKIDNMYMLNDESAFYDLHKIAPVVLSSYQPNSQSIDCYAINMQEKRYVRGYADENKIQRICKGLILKNALNNL